MRLMQVKMPEDLHAEAANYAAQEGVSLSAFVRAALSAGMASRMAYEDIVAFENPDYRDELARKRAARRARELLEAN